MNILVANWQDRLNPQAGGAEIHLHETFSRLAAKGHHVTLLVSGWSGAPSRLDLDGMDVHRTGGRYTFNLFAPGYYSRHLRNLGFDLFVEDLNKVPLFAPYWAREPLCLIVHHLFGTTAFQEASIPLAAATWMMEQPLPLVYRNVEAIAVSDSTAQDLIARGFKRQNIEVIPNGVDLSAYSPDAHISKSADPIILYLGRLKRYKRVDLILRAFARLHATRPDARLVIAGQGDARPALEQLTDELGLRGAVEFAGFVTEDQKRNLFRKAWVHMLTSSKEGWGITNIEAAACGTPTIASNVPGLRDSVQDGVTGFLVPHEDVEALAMRLQQLIKDDALRTRLAQQAMRYAQTFAWDATADRVERFLMDTAQKARG
ncbi:MAG TPA: glycosyltransferase family 4 protein [Longimicrobiales bacterium]|nr:glycosyltransferase family 4 protein [Longimicrobiales bacterium]